MGLIVDPYETYGLTNPYKSNPNIFFQKYLLRINLKLMAQAKIEFVTFILLAQRSNKLS